MSCTGVNCLGGDGGVEGLFLSAEIALLGTDWREGVAGRATLGEGHRQGLGGGTRVGDLYRELTSLERELHVVPLFLSERTDRDRGVLAAELLNCDSFDPYISIHTLEITPH